MSRTRKDRPWRLGGQRHRYYVSGEHGQHARFKRAMKRMRRRYCDRWVMRHDDVPGKSWHQYMYFD